MIETKYVVVTSDEFGEQLFTFPKSVDHDAFADVLNYIKHNPGRNWKRVHKEPVSAGFTDGITCFGRSETLELDSRPVEDTALLNYGSKVAYFRGQSSGE